MRNYRNFDDKILSKKVLEKKFLKMEILEFKSNN